MRNAGPAQSDKGSIVCFFGGGKYRSGRGFLAPNVVFVRVVNIGMAERREENRRNEKCDTEVFVNSPAETLINNCSSFSSVEFPTVHEVHASRRTASRRKGFCFLSQFM